MKLIDPSIASFLHPNPIPDERSSPPAAVRRGPAIPSRVRPLQPLGELHQVLVKLIPLLSSPIPYWNHPVDEHPPPPRPTQRRRAPSNPQSFTSTPSAGSPWPTSPPWPPSPRRRRPTPPGIGRPPFPLFSPGAWVAGGEGKEARLVKWARANLLMGSK